MISKILNEVKLNMLKTQEQTMKRDFFFGGGEGLGWSSLKIKHHEHLPSLVVLQSHSMAEGIFLYIAAPLQCLLQHICQFPEGSNRGYFAYLIGWLEFVPHVRTLLEQANKFKFNSYSIFHLMCLVFI